MRSSSFLFLSLLLTLSLSLFLFSSCNNDDDCDPDMVCDAYVRPDSGYYHIRLTIDDEFTAVYLVVFKGQYDAQDTLIQDVAFEEKMSYYLPIGQYYSTAAYYVRGNKTWVAIDGDKITTSNNQNCGEDCWGINEGDVTVYFRE